MSEKITLVNRGRRLQLSTSRITVLDLVPYFRQGSSYEEIIRWIPTLTSDEIAVVEEYYHNHKEELDRQDEEVKGFREEQIRLQRHRFPELNGTAEERMARLKKLLHQRRQFRALLAEGHISP